MPLRRRLRVSGIRAPARLATILAMTTAIIGLGSLGSTVATHLAVGDERVVLAAANREHAEALARQLGANATAASVEEAIAEADVVVLAIWLDQIRELLPARAGLLQDKVVLDASNPIGFENGQMIRTLPEAESSGSVVAGLLPPGAHYVKAFGTLGAGQLAAGAHREPRVVRFYATDDDAAEAAAQRLIRVAGFEPLKVGGVADAGRIEGPDGELQGRMLGLEKAQGMVATRGV
jgi:predicted dinucleotide-binding enzyme